MDDMHTPHVDHLRSASAVSSIHVAVFLAIGYYLPVILLWTGTIPFRFRFHVLIGMTLIMAVYAWWSGIRAAELGFRNDTLWGSIRLNGFLSFIFLVLLLATYLSGSIREPTVPSWALFFVFYVFISGPAQEFLYRSLLLAQLNRTGMNPPSALVISAVTYSFLHVFYNDLITLFVTLFMGFVWGAIYQRYPNFYGVAISHSVLGAVSIAVGLV